MMRLFDKGAATRPDIEKWCLTRKWWGHHHKIPGWKRGRWRSEVECVKVCKFHRNLASSRYITYIYAYAFVCMCTYSLFKKFSPDETKIYLQVNIDLITAIIWAVYLVCDEITVVVVQFITLEHGLHYVQSIQHGVCAYTYLGDAFNVVLWVIWYEC